MRCGNERSKQDAVRSLHFGRDDIEFKLFRLNQSLVLRVRILFFSSLCAGEGNEVLK